jgi:hypothetical protein
VWLQEGQTPEKVGAGAPARSPGRWGAIGCAE